MLCLVYTLCDCKFYMIGAWKDWDKCSTIQVDYQAKEQYMAAMLLNIEVVI